MSMVVKFSAVLVFVLTAASVVAPARAAEPKRLGVFRDWTAYATAQAGKKICYMAAEPKKDEGKYKQRGKIYSMVSHRPAVNATNVVSIHSGYKYKENSEVNVTIGNKSFTLFTHGDTAWANSAGHDKALVKAMKSGRVMLVRGVSWRNTKTKDTYSLLGFTAAHREISRTCGVR